LKVQTKLSFRSQRITRATRFGSWWRSASISMIWLRKFTSPGVF